MRTRSTLPLLALLVGVYACTEPGSPDTGPLAPETVRAEAPTVGCDLKQALSDARDYFSQPAQKDAQDLIQQMGKDCADSGAYAAVATGAWSVLSLMETVLDNGTAGAAAVGASLANALIDCIADTSYPFCQEAATLENGEAALSPRGTFSVRSGGAVPAIARDAIPFELEGVSNAALWGVEVSSDWATATGTSPVLVYGNPSLQGPGSDEDPPLAEALRYDFHTFPAKTRLVGRDFNGDLHVGVCFEDPIDPTTAAGGPGHDAVIERHSGNLTVLLEKWDPGFCESAFASLGTLAGPSPVRSILAAAGRLFVPSPLMAYQFIGAPGVGGTPFDFSTFSGVGASTDANLDVLVYPPGAEEGTDLEGFNFADAVVDEVIADSIVVTATSGDGTLMEKVRVVASIQANQGAPAGATFVDPVTGEPVQLFSYTDEADGMATLGPVALGKAGGYVLCVSGVYEPFQFPVVCSGGSHIDNH